MSHTCRFCLEDLDLSHPENLMSPCACDGSQKYVHTQCFEDWNKVAKLTNCAVCQFTYPVVHSVLPDEQYPYLDPEQVALKNRIIDKLGISNESDILIEEMTRSHSVRNWIDTNFEWVTNMYLILRNLPFNNDHYRMTEEDFQLYLKLDRKMPSDRLVSYETFTKFSHEPFRVFVHQNQDSFMEWEVLMSNHYYYYGNWNLIWNGDELNDDNGVCPDVIQRIGGKIGRSGISRLVMPQQLEPDGIQLFKQHEEVLTQYFKHRVMDLFKYWDLWATDQIRKLHNICGPWHFSQPTLSFLMEGVDDLNRIPSNTNLGIIQKFYLKTKIHTDSDVIHMMASWKNKYPDFQSLTLFSAYGCIDVCMQFGWKVLPFGPMLLMVLFTGIIMDLILVLKKVRRISWEKANDLWKDRIFTIGIVALGIVIMNLNLHENK